MLFITPEYNRSVPAVLKNAIDVGSRPYGKGAWSGKPGLVVSHSVGGQGGVSANHHLRQTLVCVNVPVMAHPEVYIGGIAALFDEQGTLINKSTAHFLKKVLADFAGWVESNSD